MRSVFDIGADLLALAELMDEAAGESGELDAEAALALDRWVAELGTDEGRKLDSYAGLIRHLETQAAVARATAEQFQRKAQARENQVRRLKQRLLDYLLATGQKKAAGASGWEFAVQANGGVVPVIVADGTDPSTVGEAFKRVRVEIDVSKARDALLMGCELGWAKLGERGSHLRLRPA